MPAKVVDASVLAAIIFAEPRANEAEALLRGFELYAPVLLAYELASIARRKVQRYPEQGESLAQALEIGLATDIHWRNVDHTAVLRFSLDTGLTTYDASYCYLARSLDLPLVTFDHRVLSALQGRS